MTWLCLAALIVVGILGVFFALLVLWIVLAGLAMPRVPPPQSWDRLEHPD